jgi:hypothetical protein
MNKTFVTLLFVFFVLVTSTVQSQTLNIISTGQTGTSGMNWSITGNTLTVTGTANIRASVIVNALANGNLTVVGNTTNFVVAVSEAINSTSVGSGLTIGSMTNAGAITIAADIALAGGIAIMGGNVQLNGNITSTATGDLFFQGIAEPWSIRLATGKTIEKTAGTGLLTMQGNSRINNSTSVGSILASGTARLDVVIINEMDDGTAGLSNVSTGNITTNGGHLWISAGAKTRIWNGLSVGSIGVPGNTQYNGIDVTGNISTNGGDILLWAFVGSAARGAGYGDITALSSNRTISSGSGDITLMTRYNDFVDGTPDINISTTGTLTLAPASGASFDVALAFSGSTTTGTFTGSSGLDGIIIQNFTSLNELVIGTYKGTGISGDTPYTSANTADITLGAAISIAGPITVYGGYVNINGNLTSSANGDIFIKGVASTNPSILLQSGKTITKSGGTGTLTFQGHGRVQNSGTITTSGTGVLNLVLWSDFDNSNNDGGVSHMGTISTNSGHVWMGGSSSNGGSYTWNGLTVGDGPSIGTTGFNNNGLDLFGNITTNGGDFLAWAGNGALAGNVQGIGNDGSGDFVNVGTGDIILITDAVSGTSGDAVYFRQNGGSFTLVPNGGDFGATFNWNPNIESVFSGTNNGYNLGTGNFNWLAIENPSTLTSFTVGRYDGMLSGSAPVVITNSSNLTFSTATTFGGSVILEGGTITLNANLTTTNNGDISLYTDAAIGGLTAARTITAAGSFNYIPRSDFFSAPVTYPITNLNLTSAGLLIGKLSNTANISFANATTIAGPITAYGGTITLNANLTTNNNGNIALYSDNPLGGLSTARTLTAAGAFKYIPRTTTFTADVTYPIANLTATSTGLTIGNTTNDKNITITQDVTGVAGIELYGANVNINSNLKTTNSGAMYLKGNATIAAEKYIESNGAFTHDGNLTFKSTATGTAAFGPLGGTFTTVSGKATIERYIPAKRAYRFLSPSVTTTTSIKENWQENGGSTAGLGTHITGTGGASNGFDATATNNPSLYSFNNSTGAWAAVTSTLTNLTAGTPYRLMVRGDRTVSLTINNPTATPTVLRATGNLKTGNYTPILNQTANGYSFVGNPYQAPIDIKAVLTASTNMNTDVVYYWDPTLNSRGTYVTRTLGIVNQNSVTSSFNQYLQPGQAVFVKKDNTANVPIMTITENDKSIVSAAAGVFRNASSNEIGVLRANLKASVNNEWTTIEGALALFHSNYTWGATQEDATKLSNLDEEVSFVQNNTSLAIAMQSNPALTDELPIKLNTTRYTNYQWHFELTNYDGLTPYLFDAQNNTFTQIENNTIVPFTVNGQEQTRFKIVFQNGTLNTPDFSNQMVLYPNPGKADSSFYLTGIYNAKVSLYNLLGQNLPVETTVDGATTKVKPSVGLSQGVYVVIITQEGKTAQVKWIVE